MAEVRAEHLVREFVPGVRALDDVTLSVADGELVVLVGPSGCGKSTLLRIIAGLETADSGTVSIAGRDVSHLTPPERNVAMVFQDYALYPHMTVRGNLEFPLRVRGDAATERTRKVAGISSMLGLDALLERLPKELSGGQRQRVAMGRALIREPAVSLLDEPLSNLDARLRSEVRAEIAELQQRTQTTMIYVTHDQVEAMTLGHRVAVLDRGVLQQAAPPAELYDRPLNAFVAGFIGNPPMNLLRAAAADGVASVTGTGEHIRIDHSTRLAQKDGGGRDLPGRLAWIGVRPEALSLAPHRGDAATGANGTLAAEVEHVELLGHETLVHARLGSSREPHAGTQAPENAPRMIARVPGTHRLQAGERLSLLVDPEAVYAFDERGNAL
ncbi:MAG TPA: ABC transporter ATP-binding protein [Candidatus Limnocylindrales bacterium]|nr:ABC transporter ATP-binding protein [Candidatus Limnocylindrales bacterium]